MQFFTANVHDRDFGTLGPVGTCDPPITFSQNDVPFFLYGKGTW